jgi:predicted nucleotidyltransferase
MSGTDLLQRYARERDALQQRIARLLEGDPRVSAAWLFGSLGREEADALSDLDVWVVVRDDSFEEFARRRLDDVRPAGDLLLYLEGPQNAPQGGAYLMAGYAAPTAPHLVDWNWQPESLAARPPQTRLLFDRNGIRGSDAPPVFTGGEPDPAIVEQPIHFLSFFWIMLMIAAKYAARSPEAEEIELLPYVLGVFHKSQRLLGRQPQAVPGAYPTLAEKIRCLRQLGQEMAAMMAELASAGHAVPWAIVPHADRYLSLIEVAYA